jgi:hypothetical protein
MIIIEEMARHRQSDFVFPGFRDGRPLGDVTIRMTLRGLGITDATTHGLGR